MPAQMARLNELAQAPETLESLKRKFMRQNRDIARANSTQSLRIRNLENETSRLLAENLGLREQIIRLQKELEDGRAQRVADHTVNLRSQLEAKLFELGSLISGLGNVTPQKKSPKAGRIIRASPSTSPDQKNWKNMSTLSEAVGGQDGRLPPILENKTYPRRTLERQEILNLVADAEADTTDSPEIGPPPVSQFVDEDPVKIDLPRRSRKEDVDEPSSLDPALSINLEQRKKRKDSTIVVDPNPTTNPEALPPPREAEKPPKTGGKRKLSVRDDDEAERPLVPPSPDDFKFTRVREEDKSKNKLAHQPEKPGSKPLREIAVPRGSSREKQRNPASIATTRKALAPKDVNDSPRKNGKVSISDNAKPAKADIPQPNIAKELPTEDRKEVVKISPPANLVMETLEILPEPETPAGVDLFSPSSSQPSTARVESRDTPPPSDFGTNAEGPRPSRRARGAVSYAEPNLRDKMRRPTKDLVDAVTREEKAQRSNIIKHEDDSGPNYVSIKAEPRTDDAWRSMPAASTTTVENSPLSSKAPESLPSSITTHRKRRESILNQTESEQIQSSSGNGIAALLAESRRARGVKEKLLADENDLTKGIERLDIYEFKASPPIQPSAPEKEIKEEKPLLRFSRRHPAIPRDVVVQDDSEASDMEAPKKKIESSASRRRQSTLGLRSSGNNAGTSKGAELQRSLTRSTSAASMSEAGQAGSRTDRISARRRSMML